MSFGWVVQLTEMTIFMRWAIVVVAHPIFETHWLVFSLDWADTAMQQLLRWVSIRGYRGHWFSLIEWLLLDLGCIFRFCMGFYVLDDCLSLLLTCSESRWDVRLSSCSVFTSLILLFMRLIPKKCTNRRIIVQYYWRICRFVSFDMIKMPFPLFLYDFCCIYSSMNIMDPSFHKFIFPWICSWPSTR